MAADASNTGIDAVLFQQQRDGIRSPVSYTSRSLTDAEKNYAVIEKEALAATWAVECFFEYLLDMKFTIKTDHKPLASMNVNECVTNHANISDGEPPAPTCALYKSLVLPVQE